MLAICQVPDSQVWLVGTTWDSFAIQQSWQLQPQPQKVGSSSCLRLCDGSLKCSGIFLFLMLLLILSVTRRTESFSF